MCFNLKFLKNKKPKNRDRLHLEHIHVQLVNLFNENRALHICLAKLHLDLQNQLQDLKDISLNQSTMYQPSEYTSTLNRKKQSTIKRSYI